MITKAEESDMLVVQSPPPLETPVFYIDMESDAKDLDWEDGDPAAMSFDDF
jgi:hypothetical protein